MFKSPLPAHLLMQSRAGNLAFSLGFGHRKTLPLYGGWLLAQRGGISQDHLGHSR